MSIPPHVNKSIKFKGNDVGAKSFGLSADDVYKLCFKKKYRICIDAMDTSPRVPFTSKSLLDLTLLTVAQIFDAASLTGGSVNLQRCYFNFTDVKNITNEYKIFNDMYTQCRIHELFGYSNSNIAELLSSYDLCYQEKCEQIYMTFYYYILIPKAIRQEIQPQYDVFDLRLSYIDEMIFVMVPTTKRGQPNRSTLDKFNTKSMLTAQIITQKGLTKNPTFKQIGTSNKRHYHMINRYALLHDYRGLGVDELCTVELLSRQFNPSINIFINAATIFDYKRALDKFQIDICKKINRKYDVYLLTHDYLAALFGILERVNIILVHQGVYYMLPINNAAINNILDTIDNKKVFGSLSKILNLPKLPNEGFSLNISNLFANSVYNSNMIYQPNITNNAIDNYIFRLSNAQNTDGRNNVELLSPFQSG